MFILEYLWKVVWQSGAVLCLMLPVLFAGLVMHFISDLICDRMGRIFGGMAYIYFTAPGVMIHELSHAFFCLIFRHKILKLQLFSPERDGTLGYVKHRYNTDNLYQQTGNFFIGTGPLWGGLLMIWLLSMLLLPREVWYLDINNSVASEEFFGVIFSGSFWKRWQTWIWIYLFFAIASHMTLSISDLSGAWRGFLYLLVAVVIFELLFAWWTGLHLLIARGMMKLFSFAALQMSGIIIFSLTAAFFLAIIAPQKSFR